MAHKRSLSSEAHAWTFAGVAYDRLYDLRAPVRWDDPEIAHRSLFRQCLAKQPDAGSDSAWLANTAGETLSNANLKKFVKDWTVLALAGSPVFLERETTRAEAEAFWAAMRAMLGGEHPGPVVDELRRVLAYARPHSPPGSVGISCDASQSASAHSPLTMQLKPEPDDFKRAPEPADDAARPSRKRFPEEPELEDEDRKRRRVGEDPPHEYASAHVDPSAHAHSQSIQPGSAGSSYFAPSFKSRDTSPELAIAVKPEPSEPRLHSKRQRQQRAPSESELALTQPSHDLPQEEHPAQEELVSREPVSRPLEWKDFPDDKPMNKREPLPENMRPRVWASTRWDLCETVPLFRSYQGGVYSKGGLTYGYMVGGHSAPRDAWLHDGKVIISHAGGGRDNNKTRATVDTDPEDNEDAQAEDELQNRIDESNDGDDISLADSPVLVIKHELEGDDPMMVDDISTNVGAVVQSASTPKGKGKAKAKRNKRGELTNDQSGNPRQTVPLYHAYHNGHPILMLVDVKYKLFPYDCGEDIRFMVLGWYWIKSIWEEAEPVNNPPKGYRDYVKLAFQWVEGQGDPWWIPASQSSPRGQIPRLLTVTDGHSSRMRKIFSVSIVKPTIAGNTQRCSKCGTITPVVYTQGWMCLESICRAFWRFEDGTSPRGEGLTYDSTFVALAPTPEHLLVTAAPYHPQDPLPDTMSGFWCRRCGRVTSRSKWEGWECGPCKQRLAAAHPIYNVKALEPQFGEPSCGTWKVHDPSVQVKHSTVRIDGQDNLVWVNSFVFPLKRGTVFHILGNKAVNGLADDIFARYQITLAGTPFMRRNQLVNAKVDGTRARYFSQNFGADYKYAAAAAGSTIPFDDAPSAATSSLDLIDARTRLLVPDARFNELLVAAYLNDQRMNFHSDFEDDLGEDIASLSLGAPAEMKFRMKEELNSKEKMTLTVKLHHGDIVVMHGIGIQQHYEHEVVPEDFRIVATARFINTDGRT